VNSKDEPAPRGVGLVFLAALVLWALTFTGHFPQWAMIAADALLLTFLFIVALVLQPILLGSRDWGLLRWWAVAAGLILVNDVVPLILPAPEYEFWLEFGYIFLYLMLLAILTATTIGVNPRQVLTRTGRKKNPEAWARFLPAVPLLLSGILSQPAGLVWAELDAKAIRTEAEAMVFAARERFTGEIDSLCMGAIRPEYFTSISQVIPLLLVALGIERRFFERFLRETVQRAITMFTVFVLSIGELLALSVLPSPNEGCGRVLSATHESIAFSTTVFACSVALTLLFWALIPLPTSAIAKPVQ